MDIPARVRRRGPVAGHRSGAVLSRNQRTGTLTYSALPGGDRSRVRRLWLAYTRGMWRRHARVLQPHAERVSLVLAARRSTAEALAALSYPRLRRTFSPRAQSLVLLDSTRPVHGPPLPA